MAKRSHTAVPNGIRPLETISLLTQNQSETGLFVSRAAIIKWAGRELSGSTHLTQALQTHTFLEPCVPYHRQGSTICRHCCSDYVEPTTAWARSRCLEAAGRSGFFSVAVRFVRWVPPIVLTKRLPKTPFWTLCTTHLIAFFRRKYRGGLRCGRCQTSRPPDSPLFGCLPMF